MLCYVMLCYVMICYVMFCFVLSNNNSHTHIYFCVYFSTHSIFYFYSFSFSCSFFLFFIRLFVVDISKMNFDINTGHAVRSARGNGPTLGLTGTKVKIYGQIARHVIIILTYIVCLYVMFGHN